MFIRQLKNRSGSTSVQIISKARGRYKVIKSLGSATTQREIDHLVQKAQQEIDQLYKPQDLFPSETDAMIRGVLSTLTNSNIQTVGPEIIFGRIFDHIGFNKIGEDLFRHLVISRIAFPLSKLKTIDYLYRYQGLSLEIDSVYRFLDKRKSRLKDQVEQIAFAHTLRVLEGKISVVF